jgi:hypothetical protein
LEGVIEGAIHEGAKRGFVCNQARTCTIELALRPVATPMADPSLLVLAQEARTPVSVHIA